MAAPHDPCITQSIIESNFFKGGKIIIRKLFVNCKKLVTVLHLIALQENAKITRENTRRVKKRVMIT